MATLERRAFISGLHSELLEKFEEYTGALRHLLEMEARVDAKERSVRLTRDHLVEAIRDCQCKADELPAKMDGLLRRMRFLGRRAADACLEVLQERRTLTVDELLKELDEGTFRFRTASPEREINAALLRQPHVKRDGDRWVYTGPAADLSADADEGKEVEAVA